MGTRCKVQPLWEGHKNVGNRPYGFEIYLVNVKIMRMISKNFVAFSEKLNFNKQSLRSPKKCLVRLGLYGVKRL